MDYQKNPNFNSLDKKETESSFFGFLFYKTKEPRAFTRGSCNVSYNRSESQ